MYTTKAYSAQSETSPLASFSFQRRDSRPQDVQIEILYCGVCHSDLHQVRNEWHNTIYPCVLGRELAELGTAGEGEDLIQVERCARGGCGHGSTSPRPVGTLNIGHGSSMLQRCAAAERTRRIASKRPVKAGSRDCQEPKGAFQCHT